MIRKLRRIAGFIYILYLKHKANRLAKQTGFRHYIVKWRGRIIIISHTQFKRNRQKGLFPKSFTAVELKQICLYYTKI